jgi:small subunit ribosomal protein S16
VATKIKLMRLGKMRAPYYRIVVADARTKRDGRSIETIGKYHPKEDPSFIEVDTDRAQYWLSVGAQPTEAVAAIFRVTGDWQKFKGEAAPPPMKVAGPKPDKHAAFAEAAAAAAGIVEKQATTPRKKTEPKAETSAESKADTKPADAKPANAKAADAKSEPKADAPAEPTADTKPADTKPADAKATDAKAEPKADAPAEPTATSTAPAGEGANAEAPSEATPSAESGA